MAEASRRRLRVLALSPIPEEGAGCRFRVTQYLPYLKQAGFDVTVSSFYSRDYFNIVYRPGNYVRKAAGFLGLASRRDLPGIDDLKAAGLLDPLEESLFQLQLESDGEDD